MTAALTVLGALVVFMGVAAFTLEVARDVQRKRDIKRAVRFARGEDDDGRGRDRKRD